MAKNLWFIVLCVLTITICSTGLVPPAASAAETRNWIDSPLYHREIPKPADAEGCIHEMWTVKTDANLDYDSKEYLPQDICVFRVGDIAYARHTRTFRSKYLSNNISEYFIAIAKGDDVISRVLTPLEEKFRDYSTPVYIVGKEKRLAYVIRDDDYSSLNIYIDNNFINNLTISRRFQTF